MSLRGLVGMLPQKVRKYPFQRKTAVASIYLIRTRSKKRNLGPAGGLRWHCKACAENGLRHKQRRDSGCRVAVGTSH